MNRIYFGFTKQHGLPVKLCSGFWNIDIRILNKHNIKDLIDHMFIWNDTDIDETYICQNFTTVNPRWKKFGYLK